MTKENQLKEILFKTHFNRTVKNSRKRILKATREKDLVTFKGTPIRLSEDFSVETLQTKG